MPCSARKSSKDEPTLPFFLRVISEHLLHALERESQILRWGLLRFLDEAVQQYHAFSRHAENHPPDLSISQVAPYLAQTVAETATIGHAERPTEIRPSECPGRPACDPARIAPGSTPVRAGCRERFHRRTPGASWNGRSIFIVPKMAHIGKDLLRIGVHRQPEIWLSSWTATAISASSRPHPAAIWTPTGPPETGSGTEIAGTPSAVQGALCEGSPVPPSPAGAGPLAAGVRMAG